MQFVWFYITGPDHGFELRKSILSVQRNVPGDHKITVIGEKPAWYEGHHLKVAPIRMRVPTGHLPFRDTQNKLVQAVNSPEIDDSFIWMMDDVYFLKETSVEEICRPIYDPWYRVNTKTIWHQLIRITFAALQKQGKSNLQYATHLPHLFEKEKLREMFALYDYPKTLLLFENLYRNHYENQEQAIPYTGFLRRLLVPMPINGLHAITEHVLNYQSKCYTPQMKTFLEQKFPEDE